MRHGALADARALARLRHTLWPEGSKEHHRRELERFFAGPPTVPLLVVEDGSAHRALGFEDVGLIRCFRKDL